jgi:hypothetical protein
VNKIYKEEINDFFFENKNEKKLMIVILTIL